VGVRQSGVVEKKGEIQHNGRGKKKKGKNPSRKADPIKKEGERAPRSSDFPKLWGVGHSGGGGRDDECRISRKMPKEKTQGKGVLLAVEWNLLKNPFSKGEVNL